MKYLLNGEQTTRLSFRLLEETDFDWWMEFSSDPESIKFITTERGIK